MNILTWYNSSGAFQKVLEVGVFSDSLTIKPTLSFKFDTVEYVEQTNRYYVDSQPMTDMQKKEIQSVIKKFIPPIEWYKDVCLSKFAQEYQLSLLSLTGFITEPERSSWDKQEREARAWNEDNNYPTPLIDGLILGRGLEENKQTVVNKIISKADNYTLSYSDILGKLQAGRKLVESKSNIEELAAILLNK